MAEAVGSRSPGHGELAAQLRVFVIGGHVDGDQAEQRKLEAACLRIGELLSADQKRIVVCSPHPGSADHWIVRGFTQSPGNQPRSVIVHQPRDARPGLNPGESVADQWQALIAAQRIASPQIRISSGAIVAQSSDFSSAFLLCQMRALLEDTDVIVVCGGKLKGAAVQLLFIAREKFPVVPFAAFRGAGYHEFLQQQPMLKKALDNELLDALESPTGFEHVCQLVDRVHRESGPVRVFLSYPWKQQEIADHVEAILLRDRGFRVFRDVDEIKSGNRIPNRIRDEIASCDVFLALWSADYAASSYCYDELHMAAAFDKQAGGSRLHVLRLDDTRPVWPVLRREPTHEWLAKWDKAPTRAMRELAMESFRAKWSRQ